MTSEEEAQSLALSHFAVGLLHGNEHGPDSAQLADKHLREALRLAPQSPLVAETLVFPLLMQRDFQGVVAALQPVLEAHPDEPHLVLLTAEALELADDKAAAILCLGKGLADGDWTSGSIFRELFTLLCQENRQEEAERLLRKTARKHALHATFDYQYTAALHKNLTAEEALAEDADNRHGKRLRKAATNHAIRAAELADTATDPDDIAAIANLLVEAEEWAATRALVESLADEFDSPDLWLLKARLLLHDGETNRACAYLAELIVYYLPEERFSEASELLVGAERTDTAILIFNRYLEQDPESLFARLQLAWLHHENGQTEKGIAALMPIIRSLPPEALLVLANLNQSLGRTQLALLAAEQAARTARALNRGDFLDVGYYLFLASIHETKGDLPASLQAARRALELEPENPLCANFVGYLLALLGQDLETAESLVRAALAEDKDNAAFLDSLAWVLYRQGRFEPALTTILRSIELQDEPDGVVLDHAGDICASLHLTDLARLYWAQALATADLTDPGTTRRKLSELAPVDSVVSRR